MMHRESDGFEALMDALSDTVAKHLAFQIESGAQAVVLFDTWAGMLGREDYRRFAAPWTRRVLEAIAGLAPRVLFAGASDHLLEELAELGAEGLALDHRSDLVQAFERTGGGLALQGNLDPGALLASPEEVRRRTRALLREVAGHAGHVLNLGHGVLQTTDPECVAAFVETALEAE
jgi:uroporphyrinogen decarboxylase